MSVTLTTVDLGIYLFIYLFTIRRPCVKNEFHNKLLRRHRDTDVAERHYEPSSSDDPTPFACLIVSLYRLLYSLVFL